MTRKLLNPSTLRILRTVLVAALWTACARADDSKPLTGPETEKRFPPLKVPAGFKATLFACDPLIEYPSAIALGPKPGSLFVAVDYMTGLGTEIVRRDEIRLIEDTDGDGYADKATVYASGFNSIEGMTFHDGVVYAMHSPLLTALRDTDGDGVADERRDLLSGLGLAPEDNPPRLHCANGITWGFDGWLYLALGDHGCDVPRPEGDRLVFNGGGILRCRTDGRDLHVFSTGLRNIYDVALDDELNVFVRDNENDGGDYKIRVCHSFFGADHGYPYLYYERPDEALPPLADLGLGSSAGGVCYLETQFPPEYRGNFFFCEWGRAVMRYVPERSGSGFAPIKEIEFAAGAENDPYGFKPTDLVVDRDGSLLIADWCDGQRPKRGRGRIYRITATTPAGQRAASSEKSERSLDDLVSRLDSESHYERVAAQLAIQTNGNDGIRTVLQALARRRLGVRGRIHAAWILKRDSGVRDKPELWELANRDPEPRVRAQAVRALADLNDPAHHGQTADPGFPGRLANLAIDGDARVRREIVTALGRLRWSGTPGLVERLMRDDDPSLDHALMQAMRRSGDWQAILNLADESPRESVRALALRAIADQPVPEIVDGVMTRLRAEPAANRRRDYADLLTRVYQKPGPWTYWGYRLSPRSANTVEWERTPQIKHAVNAVLLDPDRAVRLATLRRMQREKVPTIADTLEAWLADERDPERVAAIIASLKEHRPALVRDMLLAIVREQEHSPVNRLAALMQLTSGLDDASHQCVTDLAATLDDGPVLAAVLREAGRRPRLTAKSLLIGKLTSSDAEVRAAAAEALADLREAGGGELADAGEPVRRLLGDHEPRVRRAAALAAGKLGVRAAADDLLLLARDADSGVRRASLDALRRLRDGRALEPAVAALADYDVHVAALAYVENLGGPDQAQSIIELARRNPSAEVLPTVTRTLTAWTLNDKIPASTRAELDRAVAELQGSSGVLARWWGVSPPTPRREATKSLELFEKIWASARSKGRTPGEPIAWPPIFAAGPDAVVKLNMPTGQAAKSDTDAEKATPSNQELVWLAFTEAAVSRDTPVQFLGSADGPMRVWINGRLAYERTSPGNYQPDSDRFDGILDAGWNRILVMGGANKAGGKFHLRFRPKLPAAEQERLVQAALARPGNVERGRQLFFDAEKSQCIKCHCLGDVGERIGPELTGVGSRFSRIHIIESILEPSRTLAPSYESVLVALKDGRILTGLRVAETDTTLTLVDNQSTKHSVEKSQVEERRAQATSIMPDGLEKRITTDEFVDLIAFLVSQKGGQ
jgi:putative membrane-bound dehydrogenase-like protein